MYSGPRPHPPSTQDSPSGPRGTHVTASDSVHGQQVVAMAQLEADHTLGGPKLAQLLLWDGAAASLPDQVLQQQCVLAHALHRLQQVGGQVHLVTQLPLLVLQGPGREGQPGPGGGQRGSWGGGVTLKKALPWLQSRASDWGLFLL